MTEPDPDLEMMLGTHPCYNEGAHRKFARMHIPVAPRCNIQCNYCNRRYDCLNESRPGVTSEILSPEQAVEKIRYVHQRIPELSVIGIAGPGDPLANPETIRALELVHREFPDLTLCLSTNGLNLPRCAERLREAGVRFITVTVNSVDPEVGSRIYDFVRWEGKVLRGSEAAQRLIENQLEGIRKAAGLGMLVKVNIVFIPQVNGDHIPEVVRRVKEAGAYIVNILPLIPVPGTRFESMRAPTPGERRRLQDICEGEIRQMRHCRMCRADAIGLLEEDRSAEFAHVTCALAGDEEKGPVRVEMEGKAVYRVAVATSDGTKVDLHFGQARRFHTFRVEGGSISREEPIDVEIMEDIPMFGEKHRDKLEGMASSLTGFDIVIASGFGHRALAELRRAGVLAFRDGGDVETAIRRAVDCLFEERAAMFER